MSMSNEYIIDRIDEATRVNRDAKQVCNDALCLARGRIQNLQIDMEWKNARIEDLEGIIKAKVEEIKKLQAEVADLKAREMVEGNCEIFQDSSGNISIKCSSGSGEDRWIPCSERLPDDCDCVLMQLKNIQTDIKTIRVGFYGCGSGKWMICGIDGERKHLINHTVLAWQPLPEDYEEPVVEDEPEEVKFEIGDFVLCVSKAGVKINAIYTGEDEEHYWILDKNCLTQQPLDKNRWKLTKYPGYMSIVEWLTYTPVS